jgi:hypothetical protein
MCIKRDVFRQMMEKYPKLNYVPDGPPNPQAHLHWLFFDCMVDPDSGLYLSEDYPFCRRWRDIGGKIWVDLHCKLLHLGQHNFRGDRKPAAPESLVIGMLAWSLRRCPPPNIG